MTINELISIYNETHPTNNPHCDGAHCTSPRERVRIVPLDDSCNVHLCKECYLHEIGYQIDRELEGKERVLPDLPFEIYPIYFGESL